MGCVLYYTGILGNHLTQQVLYTVVLFVFLLHILLLVGSLRILGGTFMFTEEQEDIEEIQTFSIEESVQMKREQSKKRNKAYEDKLKVLKEKVAKLKKDL